MGTRDRTYLRTHPWLQFCADLKRAPVGFWVMLGECQERCAQISRVPLRPATSQELFKFYLVRGTEGTVAIEGNTLTAKEIEETLEGKELPPSRQYLAQEVNNMAEAFKETWERLKKGKGIALGAADMESLNKIILKNLELAEGVVPGKIRHGDVRVARYHGAPHEDCRFLLERTSEWLGSDEMRGPPEMKVAFAIIRAVLAHLYIAWIHPFYDGNGRGARLIEFQILLGAGVPALSAHLLSNHYNKTRTEYYRQLQLASTSGGEVLPFLQYAVQGFRDGLTEQLAVIRRQQLDVAWRNFVYEVFRDKASPTEKRRRDLVLALSRVSGEVPFAKIQDISGPVTRAYAKTTDRTLRRDLKELVERDLIEENEKGFRAKRERILGFLPDSTRRAAVTRILEGLG